MKRCDLAGQRFGKLTVTEATDQRKNGYMVWRCRCDCGNEVLVDVRRLRRGTARDCGCDTVKGRTDLRGRRFGMLTVLRQTDRNGPSGWYWLCRCDCGGTVEAPSRQLLSGYRKSCGCLSHPPLKDFIGRRFGMLTVTGYEGKRAGMHRWRCLCDCGRETVVGQTLLQSGKTRSCGHLQRQTYAGNLRLIDGTSVTLLESRRDRMLSSNTSGHTGVYLQKGRGRWAAQITFKQKTYYLGSYDRIEDAVKAREKGEEMRDDFLDWYYANFPAQLRLRESDAAREKASVTAPEKAIP